MVTVRRRFQKMQGSYYCRLRQQKSRVVVARGYFTFCIGPKKKRIVIKIEHANFPRFSSLLEDANDEYGSSIHNDGPICLPSDVDVFCEALAEMERARFDSSFRIVPRCLTSLTRRLLTSKKLHHRL